MLVRPTFASPTLHLPAAPLNALPVAAISPSAIETAGRLTTTTAKYLGAEALGLGCLFLLTKISVSRSTSKNPHRISDYDLSEMWTKNMGRLKIRVFGKVAALLGLLVKGMPLPSLGSLSLFVFAFGLIGLHDEIEDNGLKSPMVTAIMLASSAFFVGQKQLNLQYATFIVTSCLLSKKVDTAGFWLAGAIAYMAIGIFAMKGYLSRWPLFGMGIATGLFALYELSDEVPSLDRFFKSNFVGKAIVPFMTSTVAPVLLAWMGLLPPEWIYMTTSSYAVSKLFVAKTLMIQKNSAAADCFIQQEGAGFAAVAAG